MTFYYIVTATQGDNVYTIDANDEKDALAKLDSIYTPNDNLRKSKLITFKLIGQKEYEAEKERIAKEKLEQATTNVVED